MSDRTPALRFVVAAVMSTAVVFYATPAHTQQAGTSQEPPAATASAAPQSTAAPAPPRFLNEMAATLDDYTGDIFAWGQSHSVVGTLGDNAFLAGQTVSINGGTVAGDLFTWAAAVTIDGEVQGDVYAFTANLVVSDGATVGGNILCFCASLTVRGEVLGHIDGSAGEVMISGTVQSAEIDTSGLRFTDTAIVNGDFEYRSNEEAEVAEGATVRGNLQWNQRRSDDDEGDAAAVEASRGFSLWSFGWTAWLYLGNLIVGLTFLLLGGDAARRPVEALRRQPAPGLGFGFVVAVVFPVACCVAIVLLVTLPLGLIGLVVFALIVFLARLITAQYLGDWLLRRVGMEQPSEYLAMALGLVVLFLVGMVPYLGFLLRLTAILFGIGGIYLAVRAAGFPGAPAAPPTSQVVQA